jgi:hypothetical protein
MQLQLFFRITTTKTMASPAVLCGSKGSISYNNRPPICAKARTLIATSVLAFEEIEGLLLYDMLIFSRAHLFLIRNRKPFERHKTAGDATVVVI